MHNHHDRPREGGDPAVFAARLRNAISARARRFSDKASGVILLGGAAVLLAVRRD